jgi:hypothetical protein
MKKRREILPLINEKRLKKVFRARKKRISFIKSLSLYDKYKSESESESEFVSESEIESDFESETELRSIKYKKPKKLSVYNEFMKDNLPEIKKIYPNMNPRERLCKVAKMWNNRKYK